MLVYAMLVTGNAMVSTHVSILMGDLGYGISSIGWVQAAYFLGITLGSPLVVAAINRMGQHRLFVGCTLAAGGAALGFLVHENMALWAALRLLAGMCMAGAYTSIEGALQAYASNRVRGRVLAYYQMTTFGGISLGQFLLSASAGLKLDAFAVAGALLLSGFVPALFNLRAQAGAPTRPLHFARASLQDYRATMKLGPLSVFVAWLAGILLSSLYSLLPAAAADVGMSDAEVSRFLGIVIGVGVVTLWPVARIADAVGRLPILLLAATLICGASTGLLAYPGPKALHTLGLLYAAGLFSIYGLAASDMNDRLPLSMQGVAVAVMLAGFSVGGCMGPVLTSLVMETSGYAGFFSTVLGAGAALWISTLLTLWRRKRQIGARPNMPAASADRA